MWNLVSVLLETVLASVQDRCMVLGDVVHVESRFGLFRDNVSPGAR
jgi:hypothetical protein